jgi:hypothetical protein
MKLFRQGATLVNSGWPSTRGGGQAGGLGFGLVVAQTHGAGIEADHAEVEAVELFLAQL